MLKSPNALTESDEERRGLFVEFIVFEVRIGRQLVRDGDKRLPDVGKVAKGIEGTIHAPLEPLWPLNERSGAHPGGGGARLWSSKPPRALEFIEHLTQIFRNGLRLDCAEIKDKIPAKLTPEEALS